ncbi:MerR family transcriptional regulator [Microbacterium sp. zg.Y625]|uniref:MerR family transcriptional regulator n=1 Tax=Microbacterium jiangjiandongii TaxID=3049071 RepID=UPI00214C7DF9|nr:MULTISPECIES: MerR family transcriptional regulator [unclassified Microbacterium]MCR2791998.1 MerR family transcriptional regulator [Microbacterium sp. zg.Y625]MCR2815178.1 MerR family transcriptional regulator [Microbacterium sp. zg.Y843]WIM26954.1 MerR family transcriptional regulator [Microbacterium sp. zg-Y625]
MMQIGELAERTALSHRTIRHYDEIGLLVPTGRTEGGFRLYTRTDEERLLLIRRMKPLGYTLEEMADLLRVVDALSAHPEDPAMRARLHEIRAEAVERRERLAQQLAAAYEFVARLGVL